jgi:hypothetical protein
MTRPGFWAEPMFNLLLLLLGGGLVGVLAYGALTPLGDYAKPLILVFVAAPPLALALPAAVAARWWWITKDERAERRMEASIRDDQKP